MLRRLATLVAISLVASSPAWAQSSDQATRPASSTIIGDTGLWFVPLAETLPKGKVSGMGARVNFDRSEGFTDVSDFSGMFAFGATDRVENFGALAVVRRIDADRRPVAVGGQPMDYMVNQGWKQGFGDITVGGKFNLLSQATNNGAAFGIRAAVKLPTASFDDGLGTGKPDFLVDAILSKEINQKIDVSGFGGLAFRTSPDDYELSHGFRYGAGFGWPSRSNLKLFGEAFGEYYFDNTVTFSGAPNAEIGGPPAAWNVDRPFQLFAGVQYHTPKGFYIGSGLGWNTNHIDRGDVPGATSESGDSLGFQIRVGYHPGVRAWAPPPPPPPPPPQAPPPPANRPPTVTARCEPCTTLVGTSVTVTADATDPDGDTLTYRWTAPTGTFANASDRQTQFTCPAQPGAVPVTVTVNDGKGGTANATVTIQCTQPPRKEYTFEDVHFDFDRYSLRTEATRVLDEAIKAMQADNTLRLTVEGHTCNIGTAEYNLALGERRANAVRDYLQSRGIAASRFRTVSYGEERPKHDNAREETRRLNRRAALVVRLTR
jgi:outer membrane protein OmpA-like peptidoglycan-associated protein